MKANEGHTMSSLEPVDGNLTEQERIDAATKANMEAQGIPTEEVVFASFWGYAEDFNVILPGQEKIPAKYKQYIICEKMNEGKRSLYQKKTNSKVTILKQNQNAEMGVDPARDRRALIEGSVKGWYMLRADPSGKPYEVGYSDRAFKEWYDQANPVDIEKLEREIRDHNPWMLAEMTVDAIDEEMERLQAVRDDVERKELERSTFS